MRWASLYVCLREQRGETTDAMTDAFVSLLGKATTIRSGGCSNHLKVQNREEMKFSQSLKDLTPEFNSMTRH